MARTFETPLFTSDQSIDRVLNAGLPVLLVIYEGTPPVPIQQALERLAKAHAGKLLVVQAARKDVPEAARRFGANGLPAVVAVRDGQAHSKAENAGVSEIESHAAFLLGTGPKPAARTQAEAQPAGAGAPSGGGGQPVTVTDANFEQEVLRSPIPVVVDFWAPWCGPCRMVAPILEKLAREWSGRVKIAKVNVDENPAYAGRYGVQAIPTMLVVQNGRVVDQWAGALPEPNMRSRLSKIL